MRHPLTLNVQVRMETWQQALRFVSKNISRGGMFLAMPEAASPGTILQLSIELPDGSGLHVLGEVRHALSRKRAAATGRLPGVGVRFLELDVRKKHAIDRIVEMARELGNEPGS